ncbi:hypothetical protein HOB87_07195 [Candidatus Woesearchaeota archaeon]|nr:hypothetical protein [Candidatus Woesearchaeota archaeon]
MAYIKISDVVRIYNVPEFKYYIISHPALSERKYNHISYHRFFLGLNQAMHEKPNCILQRNMSDDLIIVI